MQVLERQRGPLGCKISGQRGKFVGYIAALSHLGALPLPFIDVLAKADQLMSMLGIPPDDRRWYPSRDLDFDTHTTRPESLTSVRCRRVSSSEAITEPTDNEDEAGASGTPDEMSSLPHSSPVTLL